MFNMDGPVLSIVVPVYNEEEVLPEFCSSLFPVLESLRESYEVIFVNDGSTDRSFEILHRFCEKNSPLKVVNLSRNFGHQAALSAGLDFAAGQAVICADADLQDPPELIPHFVELWKHGWQVVYGLR